MVERAANTVPPPALSGDARNLAAEIRDEGSTVLPSPLVQNGIEAAARIVSGSKNLWDDWLTVGLALQWGSSEAMAQSGTNTRGPGKYQRCFTQWLKDNPAFLEAPLEDKTLRAALLRILERVPEIDEWRQTLSEDERVRFNHPITVWRNFIKWKKPRPTNAKSAEPKDVSRIDLSKLAVTLGMFASDLDDEVLNAAREAQGMLTQAGLQWRDVLGVSQ
jgi:hypothetical protein